MLKIIVIPELRESREDHFRINYIKRGSQKRGIKEIKFLNMPLRFSFFFSAVVSPRI